MFCAIAKRYAVARRFVLQDDILSGERAPIAALHLARLIPARLTQSRLRFDSEDRARGRSVPAKELNRRADKARRFSRLPGARQPWKEVTTA